MEAALAADWITAFFSQLLAALAAKKIAKISDSAMPMHVNGASETHIDDSLSVSQEVHLHLQDLLFYGVECPGPEAASLIIHLFTELG